MTRSVAAHSRRADAVLVAVGRPKFLRADMVKSGAAVIDIGISQVTGPNSETTIVGDCRARKAAGGWPAGLGPDRLRADAPARRLATSMPGL